MPAPRRSRERWSWLIGRLIIVLLVVVSFVLFVLNRTAPQFVAAVRSTASDVLAPVLAVVNAPVVALTRAGQWVGSYWDARDRAEALEREMAGLRAVAERRNVLEAENAQLRALLGVADPRTGPVRVVRIVGSSVGAQVQSGLVAVGRNGGLAPGQPVRDATGLVGRVLEAGAFSARILLVTDIASRVPVVNLRTGQIGMVGGTNGPSLTFAVLPPGTDNQIGDQLVTSGHDGLFAPGVPVGTVEQLVPGNAIIRPAAHMDQLGLVLVSRTYFDLTAAARALATEQAAAEARARRAALEAAARAAAEQEAVAEPADDPAAPPPPEPAQPDLNASPEPAEPAEASAPPPAEPTP
jgi:rod shape-determining protein MreC